MSAELRKARCFPNGASVELIHAAPGTTLLDHSHGQAHLLVLLSGAFHEEGRRLSGRCVRFSPSSHSHFVRFEMASDCALIMLPPLDLSFDDQIFLEEGRLTNRVEEWAKEGDSSDEICGLRASEIVDWVARWVASDLRPELPPWLVQARKRILVQDPYDHVSVTMLADECSVSREHLSRSYRQYFGGELGSFIRSQRAAKAYRLVAESQVPLGEVALDCGFADQSHLTREFSQAFGLTPGLLRNNRSQEFKTA